jgi:dihydroflavonol-4-reductase
VALVQHLLTAGYRVRVLVRTADAELQQREGVEVVLGDVLAPERVREACRGVRGVFHLVGVVDHSRGAADYVFKVNVEGTTNVMQAAAEQHIKVVFISTSGTVGVSRDRKHVSSDRSDYATAVIKHWPYYASKRQAEISAKEMSARLAVPLVIIRPSSILGAGDMALQTGRGLTCFTSAKVQILTQKALQTAKSLEYYRHKGLYKHLSSKVPYIPDGGLNFCDVRDLVPACLAAMLRDGANGRAFLIGGPNMTLKQFFQALEEVSGVRRSRLEVPYLLGWAVISALHHGGQLARRCFP